MLKSLEAFLSRASKNILWTAGWSLFVAIFIWAAKFYITIPKELAESDLYSIELFNTASDNDKYLRMLSALSDANSLSLDAIKYFNANVAGHVSGELAAPVIADGLHGTDKARVSLSKALGFANGTKFYDQQLDSFREDFEQDLRTMDDRLVLFSEFYSAILRGEQSSASSKLQQILSSKYEEAGIALQYRVTSFSEQFRSSRAASIVKTQERTSELKVFGIQKLLLYPAGAYLLGFLVVAVVNWRRHSFHPLPSSKKARRKHGRPTN